MYMKERIFDLCFNDKIITKKLFYNNNSEYYNSSEVNFKRILERIVLKLKIIDTELLQKPGVLKDGKQERERIKVNIFNNVYKLGMNIISEEKEKYLIGKNPISESIKDKFYIKKTAANSFVEKILIPLIKEIDGAVEHNWEKIENKSGYWRELNDNEAVPVGSEVSMNFTTNKNMIKL